MCGYAYSWKKKGVIEYHWVFKEVVSRSLKNWRRKNIFQNFFIFTKQLKDGGGVSRRLEGGGGGFSQRQESRHFWETIGADASCL